MIDKLQIFSMSQGLAMHAAARQSTIAQNVANADTPGYRAKDLASFSDSYAAHRNDGMRSSRAKHQLTANPDQSTAEAKTVFREGAMSPNGNSVAIEAEMMAAAGAKREHDLALAVYKSSMNIMRTSLGRR